MSELQTLTAEITAVPTTAISLPVPLVLIADADPESRRIFRIERNDDAMHGGGAHDGVRHALGEDDHQTVAGGLHFAPVRVGDGGPQRLQELGREVVEAIVAQAGSPLGGRDEIAEQDRHGPRACQGAIVPETAWAGPRIKICLHIYMN